MAAAAIFVRAPIALMTKGRASFDSTLTASLSLIAVAATLGAAAVALVALVQKELLLRFEEARRELKILSGLLPICANCKLIRDDEGTWTQLEAYVSLRSEADFTHSLCPDCFGKLLAE